ncbi:ATP-binding protein [Candidatus Babeliales bacterium]|nr:ATP-binding protein [Candidatus Babeliales bacterium]
MSFKHIERVFQEPNSSFFLFGPRGTGKSTLVKKNNQDALLIDLLEPDIRNSFAANPDDLIKIVLSQPDGQTIIIDEVQKIPDLLSVVHLLIEKKRGWRFILTGSSVRRLKRQGVDLLGGRALKKTMHPFMACELKKLFNLDDALKYGLLPIRFASEDPLTRLQSYIGLYMEEEIKAEGLIRNYELFPRFLQAISFSHGSVLSTTNISRDCYVKRTTVNEWVSILEDMLVCYRLPIFSQRAKRKLSVRSKFYLFDVGVYRALRPQHARDGGRDMEGVALEGLVAQHLVAWRDYSKSRNDVYFWRTRSGVEVDFVVYGELGFWAIEVKNTERIRPEDLRSLITFTGDYPEAKALFLYRGKERLLIDGILCMPCEEFLRGVVPDKPLDIAFLTKNI